MAPSSIAGPSRQTPFRPVTAVAAASSYIPSPLPRLSRDPQTPAPANRPSPLARRDATIPRTPAPIGDRKGKRAIAVSEYAEGSYAVPDDPPSSKKKRKQQHESFMATEPVHGDGPYGYYGGMSVSSSRCSNLMNSILVKTTISNTPFDIQNTIQEREGASLQYQYTGQLPQIWHSMKSDM
jgi:hypothetical protein